MTRVVRLEIAPHHSILYIDHSCYISGIFPVRYVGRPGCICDLSVLSERIGEFTNYRPGGGLKFASFTGFTARLARVYR